MTPEGVRFVEAYEDCERCSRGCSESHDRDRQAMLRCPLDARARSTWRPPGSHLAVHMGADPDHDAGEPEPIETNDDGCPGGWYRTPFAASVRRYMRPCADGVYSPNVMLDRCTDRLVLDAVAYFELEQARHRQWALEQIQEQRST